MAPKKKIPDSQKKQSVKKKTGKAGVKKTTKVPSKKKNIQQIEKKNYNPIFILTIMVLLTVIALLVGHLQDKNNKISLNNSKKKITGKTSQEKTKKTSNNNKKSNNKKKSVEINLEKKRVKIYFLKLNHITEKVYLSSISRTVSKKSIHLDTLNVLIKGLSAEERRKGYSSAIPFDLKVRKILKKNKSIEIDFNSSLEKGGAGNIIINRIDQIVYTMTQFKDINSIIIKINGKRQSSIGADGLSISGPIHRRNLK